MKKSKSNTRSNFPNTRKTERKQKRLQKKVHRQEHYMKKRNTEESIKHTPGQFVMRLAHSPEPDTKIQKKNKKNHLTPQDVLKKERQKDIKETNKLKAQMEDQRRKMLVQANDDEEKVIKKLEKQLGMKKSKNKKNFFADDGLDYLLEICDRTTSEQIVAAEKHLAGVEGETDFEDDLAVVMGKDDSKKNSKKNDKNLDESDYESEEDLDDEDGSGSKDDDEESELGEDDDSVDDEDQLSDFGNEDSSSDDDAEEIPQKKAKLATNNAMESNKDSKQLNNDSEQLNKNSKQSNKDRVVKAEDLSKVFSDDEISHLSDDSDEASNLSGDDNNEEKKPLEKPDVWEDIYGRKRDKEGNVIKEEKGIYIPPHLRNKDTTSDEEQKKVQRQIQSVLNKLACTNLHWASSSIETVFAQHSRRGACAATWRAWRQAVAGAERSTPRARADHAALVTALHANVAADVGAFFLEELTKQFDRLMQPPHSMADKSLDNTVSCLAHLYNFKLFQAPLLYDILDRLLEGSTEKGIECAVEVLRTAGGALRKDDPVALKDFINNTQAKLASSTAADGSRMKFLLEVLMAVKNNNLTKIPQYDPTHSTLLQKLLRPVIRPGNYCSTLNIRLEDLLKADERGKWWVVGSAWEGNRPDGPKSAEKPVPAADQKLLELARKQRMNTDVRRNIFCVIMSAQDYMDAFEKLQHLGLKGQQEREIVHVLLACCLQEKSFNPYYAILGQKLCDVDRKYQLSIQYSTWDKIKELETLPKHSTTNLAQFLVHLIMAKSLPLSILKVIQFSDLNKQSVKFMRQILLAVVLNAEHQSSLEVFNRISKPPKLHMFRESLRLFIQHFLLKNAGKSGALNETDMAVLKERVVEVDKILTLHESKLRL